MKFRQLSALWALSAVLAACGGDPHTDASHDEPGGHPAEADAGGIKGEHGGRLLLQDPYAVELAITEDARPPRFRAWLYRDGRPLPAAAGSVEVRLRRLGNIAENHALEPQADGSLMARTVVDEPHSFDVEVLARVEERNLRWAYASYEGRTAIPADVAAEAGIRVAPVGPGTIADEHEVQGLLTPIEGRVAKVTARFPGPVRSLSAGVGDPVRAGQTLAVVDSNLSLTAYTVTSPISGVVLARHAAIGMIANEAKPLYEVADLSSLWVDLHIFGSDTQHIQAGVPVAITRLSDGVTAGTTLERVLPGMATASQSTVARATIVNADGLWRPGSAVKARITVAQQPAELVVPLAALQGFGGRDVVFIRVGDTYEARPVALGPRDAERVEVRSGLQPGDQVVVEQSYLVKADIEKSGAAHDH